MNRRDFLKIVGGLPFLSLVPKEGPLPAPYTEKNLEKMQKEFEKLCDKGFRSPLSQLRDERRQSSYSNDCEVIDKRIFRV
jgi:hypothetical protein